MTVERHRERPLEQLIFRQSAQGAAFWFHCIASHAAVAAKPGQVCRDALATQHERYFGRRFDRRIAHQIHAARVAASSPQHTAGIDQRHEHQTHRFETAIQLTVRAQTGQHVLQKMQQHVSANTLQTVHAAKKSDRRNRAIRVTEADRMHRHALTVCVNLAYGTHVGTARGAADQPLDCFLFRQALTRTRRQQGQG